MKSFNHLMFMDYIKLFAKNEKELETLIQAMRIYSQDIGMKSGIEKWAMVIKKRGKGHITEGMELPNQENIRMRQEKEIYKYLGILDADTVKQVKKKEKIKKRLSQKNEKATHNKTVL